jgi:hypothetical protein
MRRATDLVGGYRKWREVSPSSGAPPAAAGA